MTNVIYTCPDCGGDLTMTVLLTYPVIDSATCKSCGADFRKHEETKRIPLPDSFERYEPEPANPYQQPVEREIDRHPISVISNSLSSVEVKLDG
ncbi:hypothetical protein [Roseibium sp. RKSG952]|uniref:hypothetical protein n=1 Tax=Roseibium sp. RKSG952 TaxID=2529384 RepID=UPI0012BBDCA3|nr:hypothetical protein [Roseibium sp. RKSG952]MTH94526.1 hypothetical protein [Roseibium sp. RKSG952]